MVFDKSYEDAANPVRFKTELDIVFVPIVVPHLDVLSDVPGKSSNSGNVASPSAYDVVSDAFP